MLRLRRGIVRGGREPFYARAEERGNSEINQKLSLRRKRKVIYKLFTQAMREGILKSIEMKREKGRGLEEKENGEWSFSPFHWLCTQRYTSYFSYFSSLTNVGLDNGIDLMYRYSVIY